MKTNYPFGSSSGGGGGGQLSEVTLGAGPTAITHAAHTNRQVITNQSAVSSSVFSATAISGALGSDLVSILNLNDAPHMVSGNVVALPGMKLWAGKNEELIFAYSTGDDTYYGGAYDQNRFGYLNSWYVTPALSSNSPSFLGINAVNTNDSSTLLGVVPSTTPFTKFCRLTYTSAAGPTNRVAGYNIANTTVPVRMVTAATRNTWKVRLMWGAQDTVAVTDARTFVTVGAVTLAVATEPSTVLNFIGVYADSTDANLKIGANGAAGSATGTTLGAGYPANGASTDAYSLTMWGIADGVTNHGVIYTIEHMINRTSLTGLLTADLPADGLGLGINVNRATGPASANAVTLATIGAFAGFFA